MTGMIGLKDLARTMQLSTRSVRRWSQRLNVPPTVPGHASQRWDPADAQRLLELWKGYWKKKNPPKANEDPS
jgi:hypothetical protein